MKPYKVLSLLIGLLLLAACEKMPTGEGLSGRWRPVYACFSNEDEVYRYSCDGPVDKHGNARMIRMGKDNPEVKYEESITIPGIRFFKKYGTDVYIYFMMDSPNKGIGKPLLYKYEGGMLYLELPMGAFINGSLEYLEEGSGKFSEGSPVQFLANGRLLIGDTTYERF